ncbi:carbon starvation induced protein CsiD [Alkalihalobacillus oceani]|uniref:glutarate dioxygenase GlaH n=1 Tax=Halalkalibacter oceani TaxID=1653776 RepID=UPI00203E11C7|nr:glutarate dioxygenase GlaH [Halalkalibacter oceani]MCM3762288.1 carbon starvation induced protein CsiD [Halalkalibacter oceani]
MKAQSLAAFEIQVHPEHSRMRHIKMNEALVNDFFEAVSHIDVEKIEYVPFMRFYLADQFRKQMGEEFQRQIRDILHDRDTGGFTIGVQNQTDDLDNYIKFATALSHLIGVPNFDGMSKKYYARFSVEHEFDSDTYLRKAYRLFYLHTDGTFVNEQTDWVLMMKLEERNAVGGESLLLHLDDWEDLNQFLNHPLATQEYEFSQKGRASKNVEEDVYNTTFFMKNNKPCIRFNDQCSVPKTIEQAIYHQKISESLEKTDNKVALKLPVGDLILINNNFWLHGRDAFKEDVNLYRELMRQRGYFASI